MVLSEYVNHLVHTVGNECLPFDGIFGNSGKNSNRTIHPGKMFSEKKVTFFQVFPFSRFYGIPGIFCTISPHLPVLGSSR